ncbi:mupirocin-resistant isoleucine--tRNA ligase MupB [Staphylococcus saprophyticus]|nr:mupirocin-resistant isoleucine--tRNA ligase MupB [Staphylococcus saprophyticus]MDW3920839.1 mupirocin-resistant isoleucine--tRNA ligase MupB [Staphylococcus saprophyticus]MDW3948347.1 mupirocin-resistant isoleucine--tRNA ligase MupB [Staphylococcus saprophyticus]MDW3953360.1 mupirocin-resistant isoleucine--tRNA ligase MupB [Staphylococcus saprophyticus]
MENENIIEEQKILNFWKEENIFKKSIDNRKNDNPFVFYDGPPTANGLPHAGHVLGRVIKDLFARYKTMQGFYVERKAGWDTHGLPVELGVEKKLGIKDKNEIEKYGIEKFINECKNSVFMYEKQWREFSELIGYWVDMEKPYKTMDNTYIESIWYILSDFHKKGLLYKGHKVTPYCPSCETSLSSHEVAQGYKEVKDISVILKFPILDSDENFLVWTTTPWSLPGNIALAINAEEIYVKVNYDNEIFIIMESLLQSVFKDEDNIDIVSKHKGKEFVGKEYLAPFPNKSLMNNENSYKVLPADFVTNKDGTGIVHIAPAYGEDDYKLVQENNIPFINVIDSRGKYNQDSPIFKGELAKESDINIIKELTHLNLLFKKEKYEHSYPFCWRCDNPLIYYAMEGWFIKTTAYKNEIKENNQKIEWYPDHIKNGRFGNFLDNMIDWNIGRKRYWGTPLNIWKCSTCSHEFSPKSINDLIQHSIEDIPSDIELHRPYIDNVKCKCQNCGGDMCREEEVIDVWFDSGSMPFAQNHYPFSGPIQNSYPADFIAEGVDQTRGWFYSLLVISTIFKGEAPYKNALSLGHILDSNGQKMSKSKGNVIDPISMIKTYGADSLRWTLVSDSVPWTNKRFSENMVAQSKSRVIDTLKNIFNFYNMYQKIDNYDYTRDTPKQLNLLDNWAISRMNSVIKEVELHLEKYNPTNASRAIGEFINEISNWYIRRSRSRFWSSEMNEDKKSAYFTLRLILINTCKIIAPFTPFTSEEIHLNLTKKSVHLEDFPQAKEEYINLKLEEDMNKVLDIVEKSRSIRNNINIKTKQPLSNMYIYDNNNLDNEFLRKYKDIIKDEINVKKINIVSDLDNFLEYDVKPNFSTLGPKLGKDMKQFQILFKNIKKEEMNKLINDFDKLQKVFDSLGVTIEEKDFIISKIPKKGFSLSSNDSDRLIILDTNLTQELIREGFVRELIRVIQQLRKQQNFNIEERINVVIDIDSDGLLSIKNNINILKENVLINNLKFEKRETMKYFKINQKEIGIQLMSSFTN